MSVKGFKLSDGTVVKYDYSSLDNIITDSTLSVDGVAADAGAVGEIKADIGNLSELETSAKASIVAAINEANANGGSDVEVINKTLYIDGVPQDIKEVDVKVINGILYIDGVAQTIEGLDGVGISSIAKTGSSGLIDTYTIYLTDGVHYTFTVANGNADAQVIKGMINDWLDDHPEATTTVQNDSITIGKLNTVTKAQLLPRVNHHYFWNNSQPEGTSTFIELFQKIKNEIMDEYRGNMDKIPCILVTDSHSSLVGYKYLFKNISDVVNWYDISKVFNLGDNVPAANFGSYTDSTDELTTNATLEAIVDVLSPIPMDKQVNVIGNHDTWCGKVGEQGYKLVPLNLLSPYYRNAQGHRMSNSGYFSLKDDYFNVKYIIVSSYGHDTTANAGASSEQIAWLVKELGIDDGYDIVMVSHEPLIADWAGRVFEGQLPRMGGSSVNNSYRWARMDTDAIFLARKNKTSGTFKDNSGIVHTFDYSGLKGNLLCAIDGHLHYDCSSYMGNDEFLCESFGAFKTAEGKFMYFFLIDRVNSQLNIWKIDVPNLAYENYQVPFSIPVSADTFTIRRRLKNTSTYQISNIIREGQPFFDMIYANSGYTIGTVKVLMDGVDVTSTAYNSETHKIYIPSVVGNIDITAYDSNTSADTIIYTVTNNLEHSKVLGITQYEVASDEYYLKPMCVISGGSYTQSFGAYSKEYIVYDASAIIGSTDVTDILTSTRAAITFPSTVLTDDLIITTKACDTNYQQGLIGADGIFDGSNTNYGTTGYVPLDGSIVGSINIDPSVNTAYSYASFYNDEHTFIRRVYTSDGRNNAIYIPSSTKYIRVSMGYNTSYQNFYMKKNNTITNASVTVSATGEMTLGEYPNTIRRGDSLTIPFTCSGDGTVVIDSCTAGGTSVSYAITENSLVIPYTPGDIVVAIRLKPRVLYELENELTLTNSTQSINVRPMATVDDSFTIMLDYTLTEATANGTYIFRNGSSSGGVYVDRRLSGANKIRVGYAGGVLTDIFAVAKGERCKVVVTHAGGSDSYTAYWYFNTASTATPLEQTITNGGGASASRRVYDGDIVLGSGTGTITYHNLKILSEVATEQEINDFLAFD